MERRAPALPRSPLWAAVVALVAAPALALFAGVHATRAAPPPRRAPPAPGKAAAAKGAAGKPAAVKGASCLAGGCHAKIAGYPRRHTALRTGCASCHKIADHQRMTFVLVASGPRLCNLCHSWPKKLKTSHSAFRLAQCTLCHDPHGSAHKAQLKAPQPELCAICHPRPPVAKQQHAPFKTGTCSGCHAVHGAQHEGLLRQAPTALCATCHAKSIASFKGPYRHAPVDLGRCTGCHSPHQSDHKYLARRPGGELCKGCHEKYPTLKPQHAHDAMAKGCPTCHRPHAARNPKLLALKQPDLCYTCHKRKDKDKVVHSAVKLGRCSGCHDAHGSANAKLLNASRLGDVCFKCHCDDVTRRKSVHWPIKGRVCDRCHGSHGADQPKLLKKPVLAVCDGCHADKRVPPAAQGHGAQVRAGCGACHDAHASASPHLLKSETNALCGACHPKQRSGAHVFVGPAGRGHPLAGKPDPLFYGRMLSCISCHPMTSSTGPKLLRAASRLALCQRCHAGGTGKLKDKPERSRDAPSHHYPALQLKRVPPSKPPRAARPAARKTTAASPFAPRTLEIGARTAR